MIKKKLISFLFTISALIVGCISCSPSYDTIFSVGDTWNYYEDLAITLNSLDYSNDITESSLYIQLTFTINPTNEFQLKENDVYCYISVGENFYSEIQKNEELNGYNIFDISITEETKYVFYFEFPMDYFKDETGEIRSGTWTIGCHIDPGHFYIYIEI